jgi:hypothetical protein
MIACDGKSRDDDGQSGGADSGGTSGASAGTGGAASGGAGASSAGSAGSAGFNVITGEPAPCVTPEGDEGMMIDTFPLPVEEYECHALNQPGNLDPDCPSDVILRCSIEDCWVAATLSGCCRPDGFCGLLETGVYTPNEPKRSLGCIDKSQWYENQDVLRHEVVPVRCD